MSSNKLWTPLWGLIDVKYFHTIVKPLMTLLSSLVNCRFIFLALNVVYVFIELFYAIKYGLMSFIVSVKLISSYCFL